MSENSFITYSFRFFFSYKPSKIVLLFLVTLLQGFSQGVSIVLLIPLLGLLEPTHALGEANRWTNFLTGLLDKTGTEINLEVILILFVACLLSVAVLNYCQSILQATYQQGFSYEMRKRLFKKIIASDWEFLNGKSKHNHIQILTTEIPKMTNYYYYYLGLTTKIIFILAHMIVAMIISLYFTLFVVIIGFLLLIFLRKYLLNAEKLGNANIQAFRKMLKRIDDFWATVKIAKVHNSEAFFYEKFDESNQQMLQYQNEQAKNRAMPNLIFTFAGVFSLAVVVYLAYSQIHLSFASLFVLILLFARIFPQFISLNGDINMLYSNVCSVKMVLNLDNELVDHDFEENKEVVELDFKNQLEFCDVHFAYKNKNSLFSNFSAVIPAKNITGVVGKSGCGKTTFIDIIAGLQRINSGVIKVDGLELTKEKLSSWRSKLGYLPQDSFFVDGTIRENLIWDSKKKFTDEQIIQVLELVNAKKTVLDQKNGLDTIVTNYQYHFSGGERQRLALARVMLRKPKLLLLDEATSALDYDNEYQIMNCLAQLKKEVTIVFITHHHNLTRFFDYTIDLDTIKSKI